MATHVEPASHRTRLIVALGLAAIVAVVAWWRGCTAAGKEDPRIAEIRMLHEEMAARFPPGQAVRSPEEAAARATAMQAIFAKVQALPADLRGPAMMSGGRSFRASMDAKIDEFFPSRLPAGRRSSIWKSTRWR